MIERKFEITDSAGLHARPSSELVNSLKDFNSDITLEYKGKTVNLKSILGLMSMGIPAGSVVTIAADGPDENKAMESIRQVLETERISSE